MRRTFLAALVFWPGLAFLAPVACWTNPRDGTPSSTALMGDWRCVHTVTLTPDAASTLQFNDSVVMSLVPQPAGVGATSVEATIDSDSAGCHLAFAIEQQSGAGLNNVATLDDGQSCQWNGLTLAYSTGTASVDTTGGAESLAVGLDFTASGQLESDAGPGVAVAGSGHDSYTCSPLP